MIDNNTPIYLEVLAFLFIGVPAAACLYGAAVLAAASSEKMSSRHGRQTLLRVQRFLLRGRYLGGGSASRGATDSASRSMLWAFRIGLTAMLGAWLIRIIMRIFS